jgi:hypothetical protein
MIGGAGRKTEHVLSRERMGCTTTSGSMMGRIIEYTIAGGEGSKGMVCIKGLGVFWTRANGESLKCF